MISEQQAAGLLGAKVVDVDGHKVGTVGRLYLDDATGQPAWVTVNTGLFGSSETFVPLADASLADGDVRVPYSKSEVKDAPTVDVDRHLDAEQEQELYRYYGLSDDYGSDTAEVDQVPAPTGHLDDRVEDGMPSGPILARTERDVDSGLVGPGLGAGSDVDLGTAVPTGVAEGESLEDYEARTAGATAETTDTAEVTEATGAPVVSGGRHAARADDDAMTRSEERLRAGVERVPAGKARLRRYVETEMVTVEVPVRREKAVLEYDDTAGTAGTGAPAADAGDVPSAAGTPAGLVPGGPEMVLHEERPVVTTESVPVERVRLGTEEVTETVRVSDDVRVEKVALETDTDDRGEPLR